MIHASYAQPERYPADALELAIVGCTLGTLGDRPDWDALIVDESIARMLDCRQLLLLLLTSTSACNTPVMEMGRTALVSL
jgi:hypothetical protein